MTQYLSSKQQVQTVLSGNVAVANTNAQIVQDPKKVMVRDGLRAITGIKDVLPEKCVRVYNLLKSYDVDTISAVIDKCIERYDDKYNKYPSISYWKQMISDHMRVVRMYNGGSTHSYKRTSVAELAEISKKAKEISEHFASLGNVQVKAQSPFEKKVERYKTYRRKGLVVVRGGRHDGELISEEIAVANGYNYECPDVWLDKHGID